MVGLGWVPPWWRRLVRLSAPLGRSSDHESAFAVPLRDTMACSDVSCWDLCRMRVFDRIGYLIKWGRDPWRNEDPSPKLYFYKKQNTTPRRGMF